MGSSRWSDGLCPRAAGRGRSENFTQGSQPPKPSLLHDLWRGGTAALLATEATQTYQGPVLTRTDLLLTAQASGPGGCCGI